MFTVLDSSRTGARADSVFFLTDIAHTDTLPRPHLGFIRLTNA